MTLYVPATHSLQSLPFGPVEPALQMQSTRASLASNELEFEGQAAHALVVAPTTVEYFADKQLTQVVSPRSILYVPAIHFIQVPPFGPLDPASQMQSLCETLPAAVLKFPEQV